MDKNKFNNNKKFYGPRVNEKIRIPKIRVINEGGKMLGLMSPQEALAIAKSQGLDLVEIVATAKPPVCKIIEYGKSQQEQIALTGGYDPEKVSENDIKDVSKKRKSNIRF